MNRSDRCWCSGKIVLSVCFEIKLFSFVHLLGWQRGLWCSQILFPFEAGGSPWNFSQEWPEACRKCRGGKPKHVYWISTVILCHCEISWEIMSIWDLRKLGNDVLCFYVPQDFGKCHLQRGEGMTLARTVKLAAANWKVFTNVDLSELNPCVPWTTQLPTMKTDS